MKYICALLSVRDIHAAKAFYQELFGLEVAQDYGRNIAFTCGLALQQDFDWLIGVPSMHVRKKPNNMELVFEETDFDGFIEKLDAYPGIERLGGIIEHDWGQRVARFYDPDGHLIEVGGGHGDGNPPFSGFRHDYGGGFGQNGCLHRRLDQTPEHSSKLRKGVGTADTSLIFRCIYCYNNKNICGEGDML